jgi:type IV secretory pathway VirB4 component
MLTEQETEDLVNALHLAGAHFQQLVDLDLEEFKAQLDRIPDLITKIQSLKTVD